MLTCRRVMTILLLLTSSNASYPHHVLGRPSYSLSEDSNTPPSLAIEAQIGDFYVTYMVFPAFPKSNEPGRINLYIQGIDEGDEFTGTVTYSVIDDSLFSDREELLGTQLIDDGVYRQGFVFKENGKYIIRAHFDSGDTPYDIDFPLQVGEQSPLQPLVAAVLALVITLLGANLIIGRRSQVAKFRMQRKGEGR